MYIVEETQTEFGPISPVKGLKAEEYKLGHKIKGTKRECFCGKEIQEYYKVEMIVEHRDNKLKRKQQKNKIKPTMIKAFVNHGYPELYCHCNCGLKWGNH